MRNILKNYKIFSLDPKKLRSPEFYKNMLEYREKSMEKYKNSIKPDNEFQCLLCGNSGATPFLSLKNYKLFECLACGLVSPNIDIEKIAVENIYDDPAYKKDMAREIIDTYDYRKNNFSPERLEYIMEKIQDIPKKNMNILDIGCGPGYFIDYLKDKNISYKGLELADFLVEICKQRGLHVEKSNMENELNEYYNIATLFDVLEHLEKPMQFFTNLFQKLKAKSCVVAYTPNIHSFAYVLMKEKQNTLYPFQHVAFYDKKSLEFLAKKTGFEIFSIDYYGLDVMDYFCLKSYEDAFDYLEKLKDFIPLAQAIIDKEKLANHMRIIFKKNV